MKLSTARLAHARKLFISAAVIFVCLAPQIAFTSPGDLDPTFGAGGKVTTDFRGFYDNASAAALQSDGKIVAAGISYRDTISADFAMARYDTSGNLDPSFGIGGKVIAQGPGPAGILIQPDGKILIGGIGGVGGTGSDFMLARYDGTGGLDSSFGTGGLVTTDFFGQADYAYAMAMQTDGKIILVGSADQEDQFHEVLTHFAIARYTPEGQLDSTFGSQGKVVADFSAFETSGFGAVTVDGSGKILVGGLILTPENMFASVIARYNPDGSLDATFGAGGSVKFELSGGGGIRTLAVQPDGKILALAGAARAISSSFNAFQLAVVRLKPNGAFDKTFGHKGTVVAATDGDTSLGGMVLMPDGKILAVGTVDVSDTETDFVLVRYLPDGSLDPGFGSGGKITTDFAPGLISSANALVVRPNGKAVVVGYTNNPVTGNDFALAAYEGPNFDTCLQDDTTGDSLSLDSQTGEYLFTACDAQGFTLTGTAKIKIKKGGCVLDVTDTTSGRELKASINRCTKTGSGVVKDAGQSFTITDSSTADDTCSCGQQPDRR